MSQQNLKNSLLNLKKEVFRANIRHKRNSLLFENKRLRFNYFVGEEKENVPQQNSLENVNFCMFFFIISRIFHV